MQSAILMLCLFAPEAPPHGRGLILPYDRAVSALRDGDVLITFVGCKPFSVPDGCIRCRAEKLNGFPPGCVVISVKENGRHLWYSTITNPTPEKIRKPTPRFFP